MVRRRSGNLRARRLGCRGLDGGLAADTRVISLIRCHSVNASPLTFRFWSFYSPRGVRSPH